MQRSTLIIVVTSDLGVGTAAAESQGDLEKVQFLEWRALLVAAGKDSDVPGATRGSTWGREALGWLGALG